MRILIFGLPGAGKTHLAERLQKHLNCAWYNADEVRRMANDWDFTPEGRNRQAERMWTFSQFESKNGRTVICDFVCPTEKTREQFNPDYTIWMNTIEEGRFEDTNKMFEEPRGIINKVIEKFLTDEEIEDLCNQMRQEYALI